MTQFQKNNTGSSDSFFDLTEIDKNYEYMEEDFTVRLSMLDEEETIVEKLPVLQRIKNLLNRFYLHIQKNLKGN